MPCKLAIDIGTTNSVIALGMKPSPSGGPGLLPSLDALAWQRENVFRKN